MSEDIYKGHGSTPRPHISVIVPAYNAQHTILRALKSVISQTIQPVEIIVIDDGSVDNTIFTVNDFSHQLPSNFLKVVRLDSNRGPAYARNVGWDMASGEFLAFLDADDSWHPRKLEIQADYMLKHNELTLTGHKFICLPQHAPPPILPEKWKVKPVSGWQLLVCYYFSTPSVMVKRDIPYRFNPFKRYSEDRLLWLQIVLNGYKAARLELPLAYLHKAPYGEYGLSSHLWEMEKAELDNYTELRKMGLLNRPNETLLKSCSLLKYVRRICLSRRR